MPHKIHITPEAADDLRAIGDYIAQNSPETAHRFMTSIERQIATLQKSPARHGRAPEAALAGADLRQMMHGLYRVLYTLDNDIVTIHAIRHGARRPLRSNELPERAT